MTLHIQRRAFTTGARWCQAAWWTGRASPSLTILDCVEHVEYVVCSLVWTVVAAERRCAMAQEMQGQCPTAHPSLLVAADVPGEISGGGSPPPPSPCLCPAETCSWIHYALELKGSALVDMWRTRTWPGTAHQFQRRSAWTSHWSPAPRALPAPKELLHGSWCVRSDTFSSIFALHRLTGRQHADLGPLLNNTGRRHCSTTRKSEQAAESSRSQPERRKTPAIFASPDSPCSSLLRVCTGAVTSGAGCGLQASTVSGVAPLSG